MVTRSGLFVSTGPEAGCTRVKNLRTGESELKPSINDRDGTDIVEIVSAKRNLASSSTPEKKVRFLESGPPRVAPNWLRRNGGLATGTASVNVPALFSNVLASSLSWARNSNA